MHRDPEGYYTNFGVTPEASTEEITRAFLKKVRRVAATSRYHRSPSIEYAKLRLAFETLSNFKKRKLYDRHWGHQFDTHYRMNIHMDNRR